MNCPICNKAVSAYYESPYPAWLHANPLEGLMIYGPASADKQTVCENKNYLHFIFADLQERLVRVNYADAKSPSELMQQTEIDFIHCQYCGQEPQHCDCKNNPSIQLQEQGIV